MDPPWRFLSGPQVAAVQTRNRTAERGRGAALYAAVRRAQGNARARHAALCISHAGDLPRTHESLQQRDCAVAGSTRADEPIVASICLQLPAESSGNVYVQLFFPVRIPGRA